MTSIYLTECWAQFKTVLKQTNTCEDVQTESCTRHCDNKSTHVSQVTDSFRSDQRQYDVVVLLTLVTIYCRYLKEEKKEEIEIIILIIELIKNNRWSLMEKHF